MRGHKKQRESEFKRTVIARIPLDKYEELQGLLASSRLRTMSELLRHILENRKVVVEYYDKTLDKVMFELSGSRKELQSIGVNINQVTRQFHIQEWPEAMLINAKEIERLYRQVDLTVQKLFNLITQIAEKWLPE